MTEFDIVTGNFTKYESTNDSLSPRYSYGIQNMRTRLVLKIGAMCVIVFFAAMLFYPFDNRPHLEFKDGEWTYFSSYFAPSFFRITKPVHEWSETSRSQLVSFLRGDDGADCSLMPQIPVLRVGITKFDSGTSISTGTDDEPLEVRNGFWCEKEEILGRYMFMRTSYPEADGVAEHFDSVLSESIHMYDELFQSEKRVSADRKVVTDDDLFGRDFSTVVSSAYIEWKDSNREVTIRLALVEKGEPGISLEITDKLSEFDLLPQSGIFGPENMSLMISL